MDSGPSFHSAKMSSMNLIHTRGLSVVHSSKSSSNLAMNRFAYEGAILVPIAIPCTCRYCSLLKIKLFLLSICSIILVRMSVDGCRVGRLSRATLHASVPSLWGMLVYNELISTVTRM